MRAVALGLATLLATMSAGWAQDEDGALCSTAQRASAGTLPAVVQACNQALQAQSTAAGQAKMLRYRGIALARGGNLPAAVADFDQVLQTTPDDTAALQGRAQTYEALGQRAQAAADYGRLAALRPGDTRWRIKVAALGGAAAQPSATAVRAPAAAPAPPTQLVQARPAAAPATPPPAPARTAPTPLVPAPQVVAQAAPAQSSKGLTIVGDEGVVCATAIKGPLDTMPAVIRACGKIQAKQPTAADRARVLRYRGVALQRTGEMAAAIADFDQVLALTPEDTWALQGRAEAHEALGHNQQAIADYGRLAALRPGDTRWRIKMSQLGATPPTPIVPPTIATTLPPPAPPVPEPETRVATPTPPPAEEPAAPAMDDPTVVVRKLQTALRALGYDVGAVNGRVGAKTRQALDAFAADVGLQPGAEPDQGLLAAAEDALRHRSTLAAEEQRKLNMRAQQALLDLGYDIGDVDGAIGARSRSALRAWSSIRGRPVTEVDEQVVASLEQAVVEQLTAPQADSPAEPAETPTAAAPSQTAPTPSQAPPIVFDEFEADVPAVPPVEAPSAPSVAAAPAAPPQAPAIEPAPVPAATRSAGGYDIITPVIEAPEKRVALVIGNGGYQAVTPLVNPKNDADDVSVALSELGFEVLKGVDLSRDSMSRITKDFARRTRTADIAMAYYSGHGMQFERTNYLVPVDVQIQDEYDLREMVELSQVIEDTGQAKKLALVVVDACRDDPLATKILAQSLGSSRSTSLGQGLAAPKLPTSQSLIAYATAADFVAYDGGEQSRNSPFTAALLKNIRTPKLDVRQLFGKVSDAVRKETGNAATTGHVDGAGRRSDLSGAGAARPGGPGDVPAHRQRGPGHPTLAQVAEVLVRRRGRRRHAGTDPCRQHLAALAVRRGHRSPDPAAGRGPASHRRARAAAYAAAAGGAGRGHGQARPGRRRGKTHHGDHVRPGFRRRALRQGPQRCQDLL